MDSWSPWKSWWMDLIKFFVTFGVGAMITVLFLNSIEAEQTAQRVRCQTIIDSKLSALNSFSKSSLVYNEAAYDAWTELYRWREREMTGAMRRYTEDAHELLTISVEEIRHRFSGYQTVIETVKDFEGATYRLWRVYDTFVDTRLDRLETEENVPQIPRSGLEAKRGEFDNTRKAVSQIRKKIIEQLEYILYKSSYEDLCTEIGDNV